MDLWAVIVGTQLAVLAMRRTNTKGADLPGSLESKLSRACSRCQMLLSHSSACHRLGGGKVVRLPSAETSLQWDCAAAQLTLTCHVFVLTCTGPEPGGQGPYGQLHIPCSLEVASGGA